MHHTIYKNPDTYHSKHIKKNEALQHLSVSRKLFEKRKNSFEFCDAD
jgi:hypothetical protein